MHLKALYPMAILAALALERVNIMRPLVQDIIVDERGRTRRLAPTRTPRGNGAQAKPKRRSNRLHVSKRVRRAHRRAA